MPFWDDVSLSSLPDLSGELMLVDVFDGPQRFRFSTVGNTISKRHGTPLAGTFSDELEPKSPLHFFNAQASMTVEARTSTFYRHESGSHAGSADPGYSRLILPLWGNGRVGMLLGGFSLGEP